MAWHTRAIIERECTICRKKATVWLHNPTNDPTSPYCKNHGEAEAKRYNEAEGLGNGW